MTSEKQTTPKVTDFAPAEPGNGNGSAAPYAAPVRQTVALSTLHAHDRNYKKHSKTQIDRIKLSLQTFGQGRSVVIWHDTIIAGHGVVAAARALGWQTIQVDALDPEMPQEIALAYLVADNELARLADPDQAALAALLQELGGEDDALLAAMGWDDAELRELLREVGAADVGAGDAEPQVDRAEELRGIWGVETGQLWQLGEHRLICGDCTDAEIVARVMQGERADCVFTDPPYNVASESRNYAADKSKAMMDLSESEWDKNFDIKSIFPVLDSVMAHDCAVYVCTSQWLVQTIWEWMWSWSDFCSYCVWCKPNPMPSLSKRHWTWATELIPYAVRGRHVSNFPDGNHALNWWDIPKSKDTEHPTEKVLAVPTRAIEFSSNRGAIVFDGFAGSGTTGIACHNLHRRARMVEISPAYCSVILQRFADAFPGLPITRLEPAP